MELTMQLSRTVKGQEEIFNSGHSLRPRQRQILFSVGNGISFGELRNKLPNCADLETMVDDLLHNGFIHALRNMATTQPPATVSASASAPPALAPRQSLDLAEIRSYVLEFMAGLVGTKSPAYRKMSEAQDLAAFRTALPVCFKVIAAVASPHQAAELEAGVAQRLGSHA